MATTNITTGHERAFQALTGGQHTNFALMSVFCDGQPASAIVTVDAGETKPGHPEYLISPIFVSVTPAMKLTDHDGQEPGR